MLILGWLQNPTSIIHKRKGGGLDEMVLTNTEATEYQRRNDIRDIDFAVSHPYPSIIDLLP